MKVNDDCICCGACKSICEDIEIEDKAIIPDNIEASMKSELIDVCPVGAIEKE